MKKVSVFLGVFFTIWSAATISLDIAVVRGIINQFDTPAFVPTTGTVTRSEVKVDSSDDGTSYTPRVSVRYTVSGRTMECNRIRFTMLMSGGRNAAYAFTQQRPVGATTTVYYDAADPDRAVLERGMRSADYLSLIFAMPFNAVVGVAGLVVAERLASRRRSMVGGLRTWEEGGVLRIRTRSPLLGWMAGIGLTGILCFIAIFILCLTPLRHFTGIVLGTWFGSLAIGGIAAARMQRSTRRGDGDIVIDPVRRHLTTPRLSGGQELPFSIIKDVVVTAGPSAEDGPSSWNVDAVHESGTSRLASPSGEDDARALAAWMKQRVGLP